MKQKDSKTAIAERVMQKGPVSVKQITLHFGLFPTMIHRHLKSLLEQNKIIKIGKPPKVLYMGKSKENRHELMLSYTDRDFLDKNYYNYDSDGKVLVGYEGFVLWCEQRGLDIQVQCDKYKSIYAYMQKKKDSIGLIDGHKYLSSKLGKIYVHALSFIDPYQIGHFGRSKLGTLTFYAKQSQNMDLIKQVVSIIKYPILSYVQQNKIDTIAFVPPSIKRGVQFMTEIKKLLAISLLEIKLIKVFPSGVIIPQKSLKSMEQRIKNAQNTLFVSPGQKQGKKILLLDDFMGSGATINFCAKKILDAGLAKQVFAICLLGNVDTEYDVINEI